MGNLNSKAAKASERYKDKPSGCKASWVSSFSFMVLVVAGLASSAQAQSLGEALALTYETNPALKAQRAALRASDELAAQARAERRPSVNGQATLEMSEGSYTPPAALSVPGGAGQDPTGGFFGGISGAGNSGTDTAGVQFEQPLFKGFRAYNAIREADARIDAARAGLVAVEQQVLGSAAAGYLRVNTTAEQVRVAELSLGVLSGQRAAAQTRFETGQATRTDVAQAEARLASAKASLISAQADFAAARLNFERLVGQAPGTLERDPALPALPANGQDAVALAMAANPDLLMAQGRKAAAVYNVRVAKSFLSPSVSAVATYGVVRNQFIDGDKGDNTSLMAQFTVPLFQGGVTYSRIRQAKAAEREAHFLLIEAERRVGERVQSAWQRMLANKAAYDASQSAVMANELAFEGVQLERELGQRSTLEVLDGERELRRTRLNTLAAKEAWYLSAFVLLQEMGQLTAQGLALDVALYDAQANKRAVQSRWFGTGAGNRDE